MALRTDNAGTDRPIFLGRQPGPLPVAEGIELVENPLQNRKRKHAGRTSSNVKSIQIQGRFYLLAARGYLLTDLIGPAGHRRLIPSLARNL